MVIKVGRLMAAAAPSVDIVHDMFHFRHAPKWMSRFGAADGGGGGAGLCVACVVEMMESPHISVGHL